jgi:glycosyltransferase involved in cell wall biosynthesis
VGRLHPAKRPEVVIKIGLRLRNEGVPVRVRLVGDGHLFHHLIETYGEFDWIEIVHGVASDPEMASIYERFSCLVVPSSYEANEGLPVAALEAIALSVPVVSTDVGAVRSALGDAVRIVPVNDFDSLVRAVQETLRGQPLLPSDVQVLDESSYATALLEATGQGR